MALLLEPINHLVMEGQPPVHHITMATLMLLNNKMMYNRTIGLYELCVLVYIRMRVFAQSLNSMHPFIDSLATRALTHLLTHSLTHLLMHSLIHTPTYSLAHSHTHLLTRSLTHPPNHPLTLLCSQLLILISAVNQPNQLVTTMKELLVTILQQQR